MRQLRPAAALEFAPRLIALLALGAGRASAYPPTRIRHCSCVNGWEIGHMAGGALIMRACGIPQMATHKFDPATRERDIHLRGQGLRGQEANPPSSQ